MGQSVEEKKTHSLKMVPEADLIAFKKGSLERERQLKEKLTKAEEELAQTTSELDVAKMSVEDDEEISKVKDYLLQEGKKLRAERMKLDKDLASIQEREKEARASELVANAKSQYGVDITKESILTEENMESKVHQICLEALAKEKEETPGSIYESGAGGGVKVAPKDMKDADFDAYVKQQRDEALSKK